MSAERKDVRKIAVVGAGSWGTAIGTWLARNGHEVRIWDIDQSVLHDINNLRTNRRYLPEIELPPNLIARTELADAMDNCSMVVVAIPSLVFENVLKDITDNLSRMSSTHPPSIVWGTKGFAPETSELLSSVADRILPKSTICAVLSGPSFAIEVMRGLPTGYDLASNVQDYVETIADVFRNEFTLVYTSSDIVGVQVGGATKNIIAIASGIAAGMGFGINTRCLVITRGLAEMNRLNVALGGKEQTLMGLSGLGDLVLTCSSELSRNFKFGLALGQGRSLEDTLEEIGQEVQGIETTREVYQLGQKHDVFMPTTTHIYQILFEQLPPALAAQQMLAIGPTLK